MLFTNEELRHFFMKYYTYDLSLRLVQNNFMSLPVERKMVFDFDVEAGVALLDDINRSARVMRSFGTYLLNKIDGDSSGNKFFSFVRQGGMFSVLVGNMWNWKQLSNTTSTFSNLPLPALLQEARSEFEAFYSTNAVSVETEDEESSSTLAKRKLYWCNGLGSITLDCWLRNKKVSTVVVNEPQYCVIDCIANASTTSMTLADLSFQLNLPLETVSEVVVSLLTSSPKILSIQDKATLHKQVSSAIVHRSILCAKSEISFEDIQLRNRGSYSVQSQGERNDVVPLNVHYMHQSEHTTDESNTWRAVRVDAQVLRILKKQQALYPSTKGCTLEQIVNKVLPSLRSSFSYVLFYEKDIEESCQRLVKQGILDRDLTSTKEIFTYLFISSKQEGDGSIKTVVSVNSESNLSKIISSCIEISSLAVEEQPQEDLAIGESKEESTKTLENSCDQLLLTIAKLQPFPAAFTLSSQREDFAKQISQTATGLVLFVSSVITQLHYLIADNFPSPFLGSLDAFMHNAKLLAQQPSKELLDCVSLFIFTKLPQNVIDSILTVFVSLVDKKGVDAKTNTTLQHILMHGVSLASWSQLMALWTYSFTSKESVESKFTENEQFSTSLTLSQIFMNSISIKDVPQSKIRVGVRSTKEKANKEKEEIHVVDLSKPTHLTLNTLLQQVTKQCAAYVGVQEYEKEMSFDASTDGYSIDDINFLTEATFSFMMQDLHSNIVDCIWWKTPLQTNLQSVTQQAIRVSQEVLKNPIVSSLSSSAPSDDIDAEPSIQSYENNLQKLAQMMKVPIEEASLLLSLSDWDTLHLLDNWFSASQPEQLIAHARKFKRQQIQDGKDLQIRCPFCQQNYPMDRMVYASTCGHSACHDCWNSHIDSYHISEEHFPAIPCIQNSHQPATCSCWLSTDMIATCLSIDNSVISSKLVHAHRLIYDKNHSIDVVNITATTSTTTNTSTLAKCKYCRTYECLPSLSVNKTHSRLHETSLYGYFHGHNKKQIDEIQSTLDALQAELKYCRLRDDLDNILLRWQYWNHVLECELLADHCQKLLVLSDSSLELTQLMRWQESFLDFPKVNTPKIEELHQVRFLRVHINTLFEKLVRNMGDDHQEQHCRVSSLYLKDIHRLNSHRNAFGDLNVTYLTCLVQPRAMEMSMQLNLVKLQTNMQLLRQCEHIPREDIILKMKDLLDAVEGLNQQDRFMLSSLERTSGTTVVDFQAVATVAEALEYMISDPDSFVIMLAVAKAYFELILHILSHSHTRAQQTSMTQDQHYINRTWQSLQQMLCSAIELYDHSALNIIYNCLKVFQYYLKVMRKLNVVNVMWEQDQRILQILSSKLQSYKDLVEVAECGSALEKMEEILEYCKTVAQLTTNFDANVDCLPNSLLDLLFASLKLTISLQTKSLAVPERAWEVTFVNCLQCALLFSTYDTSHYKNTPLEVSLNNFSDKMWKNSDIFFSLLMKTLRKVALQTSAKKDNHILTHDHMRRHFGLLCSCIVAFTTSSTQQDTKMFNHGFDHFQEAITHLLEWKWTTTSNAKPTASQSQHNFDLVNLVMKIITSYCAHLTEESRSKFKSEIIYEKLRYIREEVKLLFKEATSLSRRLQSHWCQHHVDECLEVVNKLRAPKPRARDAQSPNRDSLRSPPPTRTNSFPPTNANETQMLNILFNEVLARNQTRAQDGNNNNAENNQVPMRTLLGQLLNYTNAVQNIEQRMQQEIQAMNHPMQMPMAAMMLMRRETDEQNRRELLRGAGNNNNNLAMTDRLRDSDDDSSDDHHSRSDSSDSSNDSEDF